MLPPIVGELRVKSTEVHEKFKEAMQASDELAKKTTGDSEATGSAFDKLGRTGKLAFSAIGAGVGELISHSAEMAGDFQEKMTLLVTGAGESKDKIADVSQGILNLAPQVATSTDQMADGMYMIESAGYHGADGLNILKSAAEGAKVGNADLGTTADALTTIMTDYHVPTAQAADVTSKLVATVASGKTHMADLASSMSHILPFAAGLGVTLNDTMGAMATMTGQGIQADEAATYLKFTMMALANETPKGAQALKDVGLSAADVANDLKSKGLHGTLDEITEAIGKKFPAGSAEYTAALSDIVGGTRGMASALALTGDNAKTYEENIGKISEAHAAAGNSVEGFDESMGDLNNKTAAMRETFNTLAIKIGTALIPTLTNAAEAAQNIFGYLESHNGVLIAVASIFGGLLSIAIGAFFLKAGIGIANTVKSYASMVTKMVDGGSKAVGAVGNIAKGFSDAANGVDGAYGKMGGIGARLAGMAQGFGSAASAATSWAKDTVMALGSNTKALAVNTIEWLKNDAATMVSNAGKLVASGVTKSLTAVQAALDVVMNANPIMLVVIAITALVAGFIWAYNSIGWFKDGVNAAMAFVRVIIQNVVAFITAALGVLGSIWNGFWNGPFGQLIIKVFQLIMVSIQFAIAWIAVAIKWVVTTVSAIWNSGWAAVSGFLASVWNNIMGFLGGVLNWMASVIISTVNAIAGFWNGMWASISGFFMGIWNSIVGFLAGVWSSIFGTVASGVDSTSSVVSGGLNNVWSFFSSVWNNVIGFLGGVWNNIVSGVSGGIGRVVGYFSGLGGQIMGAISGIAGQALAAGANIVGSLAQGISNGVGQVVGAIGGIIQTITDHMPHSPAKRGPLSGRGYTLYSGQKLVSDLALGMTQTAGSVSDAAYIVAGAATLPNVGFGPSRAPRPSANPYGGDEVQAGGGGNTYITVHAKTDADAGEIASEVGYQLLLKG
jgi:TP901 family phage tail tape measure protein